MEKEVEGIIAGWNPKEKVKRPKEKIQASSSEDFADTSSEELSDEIEGMLIKKRIANVHVANYLEKLRNREDSQASSSDEDNIKSPSTELGKNKFIAKLTIKNKQILYELIEFLKIFAE